MDAISCTMMMMKKKSWVVAMVMVVGLILGAVAELERMDQPCKIDGDVSFLVIGDWGRKGNYNQTLVANQTL